MAYLLVSVNNIGKLPHGFTVHNLNVAETVAATTMKTGAMAGAKEMAVVSWRATGRTGTARGEGSGGQRSVSTGMYFLGHVLVAYRGKECIFSVGYNCMK